MTVFAFEELNLSGKDGRETDFRALQLREKASNPGEGCVTFSYLWLTLQNTNTKILRIKNVSRCDESCFSKEWNGTKIVVDRDFLNIWWLLKEPFVCESKLI